MRFGLPAVALAAALMLAGCGGNDDSGGSDEPVISAEDRAKLELVSDQLELASKVDSGARLCSFLQPSLFGRAFESRAQCARQVGIALARDGTFEKLEIKSIAVTKQGAIVTYEQEPPGEVKFVKEGGAWYIDLADTIRARGGTS